ncbi:hypothetical protein M2G40_21390 [Vibrio vulnificus]|nr:hypothetical protein [Vibrio vulnificus]MCU8510346.1 hypothetical protein [Vibrio vulnificus]
MSFVVKSVCGKLF